MSEIIFGRNTVVESIKQNKKIEKICTVSNNKDIIDLAIKNKIAYEVVSKEVINNKVTGNHQGVIAYVPEYKYFKLEEIVSEKEDSLVLMLDCFEDPHNLGAVIRTSETAGVDGIIIPKNRSVKVNSTVSKVSTGATEYVKVCEVTNLVQTLKELKKQGYWVVGAEYTEKSVCYWDLKYDFKTVLVIGSEGKGISRLVRDECDYLVKIPMVGKINSLNASVSAALIIYEIRRKQYNKWIW